MKSTIGQRIRAARQAACLTQQEFADLVEVSRTSVAKWEAAGDGVADLPATKRLPAIASALGVTIEYLMDDNMEVAHEATIDGRAGRAAARTHRWKQRDLKLLQRLQSRGSVIVNTIRPEPARDRQSMNFWAAVEYDVLERLPGISSLFGLQVQHSGTDYVRTPSITLPNDSVEFITAATEEEFMNRLGRAALDRALFGIKTLYLLDHLPPGTLTDEVLRRRRALASAADIEYFYVATRAEAVDVIFQLLQPFFADAAPPLAGAA